MNKLEKIISEIKKDIVITIDSREHKVLAKAKYVTQKSPDNFYFKILLSDHYVLVIAPADEFISFGRNVGDSGVVEPFADIVKYNNEEYKKIIKDYQIMVNLEFGSPIEIEGEVEFWDYECISDESKIISVGYIKRTGERADIIGKVISIDNLNIIK